MSRPSLITGAAALLLATVTLAQSPRTEHTLQLDDPERRPSATLEDVKWLTGSWQGTAFGASFEQTWNPASAGSMVGLFKVIRDDAVDFYELLLLIEEEGSLSLKVKHFTPEFVAWETKEDYIDFRLVRIDDDAIHFSGLSFYRRGDDTIEGYIAMRSEAGVREERLDYRRVR